MREFLESKGAASDEIYEAGMNSIKHVVDYIRAANPGEPTKMWVDLVRGLFGISREGHTNADPTDEIAAFMQSLLTKAAETYKLELEYGGKVLDAKRAKIFVREMDRLMTKWARMLGFITFVGGIGVGGLAFPLQGMATNAINQALGAVARE